MPEFNIENEITEFLSKSATFNEFAADSDDSDEDGSALDIYRGLMIEMIKAFGIAKVVHNYMAVRFAGAANSTLTHDEAYYMANGFMMGLQMGVRQREWAEAVVADLDSDDEDVARVSHQGQDSLAALLPVV